MGVMGKQQWGMPVAGASSYGRREATRPTGKYTRTSSASFIRPTALSVLIAVMSAALLGLVSIYGAGLRDPRYLDGWVLTVGMSFQLGYHVALKTGRVSPKSAARWRKLHIILGLLLVSAFISHSDFSLPDTALEWALWACFVLVTLSGIASVYLDWARKAKRDIEEGANLDRISTRRLELTEQVQSAVEKSDLAAVETGLPAPPYDAWIAELYVTHLAEFFSKPCNSIPHLIGSQRTLKQLTSEIDGLSRYVDKGGQEKLGIIRKLVIEKNQLDVTLVYLALSRYCQFVHVPVTYSLFVLTVLHVLAAYAFSSGAW